MDIEKAFDSVFHYRIIYKLINLGVDKFLVKILCSYLNNRKFGVQINNITSDLGPVNNGVPQGGVLAHFLFKLFLHDFPHFFGDSKASLYADDCFIFTHNKSPVKALHIGEIGTFCKKWGFTINAAKSQAICIRIAAGKCPRNVVQESKSLPLTLDGINIPFKNNIKYLGVQFDKLLKFNNHTRSILEKTKRYLNTKVLIYKVAIRSENP